MRFGQDGDQAARHSGIVADHQETCRLGGQGESLDICRREGAVEGKRLEMQLDEDRIERVLDDTRVAPGGAGRDPRALEQHDPATRDREVRRARHADDPAADHDDVRCGIDGERLAGHRGR